MEEKKKKKEEKNADDGLRNIYMNDEPLNQWWTARQTNDRKAGVGLNYVDGMGDDATCEPVWHW